MKRNSLHDGLSEADLRALAHFTSRIRAAR